MYIHYFNTDRSKAVLLLWFLTVTCSCLPYLYFGSPIMWVTYLGSWMTTCLGKSCSFGLPRVLFVHCCQCMYLVIFLLVLRAGYGIWLYQFLIMFIFLLFNARLLLTEVNFFIFYFISKCKNVFKALKMNITTKAGKLKSTDQFDSRRVKIWKRNFEMHFKGLKFAQMITSVRSSFPGRLSDTIG